jgi:hypothetical protein
MSSGRRVRAHADERGAPTAASTSGATTTATASRCGWRGAASRRGPRSGNRRGWLPRDRGSDHVHDLRRRSCTCSGSTTPSDLPLAGPGLPATESEGRLSEGFGDARPRRPPGSLPEVAASASPAHHAAAARSASPCSDGGRRLYPKSRPLSLASAAPAANGGRGRDLVSSSSRSRPRDPRRLPRATAGLDAQCRDRGVARLRIEPGDRTGPRGGVKRASRRHLSGSGFAQEQHRDPRCVDRIAAMPATAVELWAGDVRCGAPPRASRRRASASPSNISAPLPVPADDRTTRSVPESTSAALRARVMEVQRVAGPRGCRWSALFFGLPGPAAFALAFSVLGWARARGPGAGGGRSRGRPLPATAARSAACRPAPSAGSRRPPLGLLEASARPSRATASAPAGSRSRSATAARIPDAPRTGCC